MTTNLLVPLQLFSALGRLTPPEQARVNAFILEFQRDPKGAGISLERLQRARSPNLWSGRVSRDLRAILHKDGDTWAILHVDHHDDAYAWAERREVGRHRVTGALQIVEAVETVREVERIVEVLVPGAAPPTFADHEDVYLLSIGVPESWLPTLRQVRSDDDLLVVCERLPQAVSERLLTLASGELVTPPTPVSIDQPVTAAPDTRRGFYVVEDVAGLAAALAAPMDQWIAFLHPSQQAMVERTFAGPAKVSGSAGTGKTVVAMHRARHLARLGRSVLLTSYVSTLCDNVGRNLDKLCTPEERARIDVSTVHKQALAVVRRAEPHVQPSPDAEVAKVLAQLRVRHAPGFDAAFVESEWSQVVRLQGLSSWDAYRTAVRTGRGRGLAVRERKALWGLFDAVLQHLASRNQLDFAGMCVRAEELLASGQVTSPYDAVIVDEVQDLKPPELRFLRALCATDLGGLMVCGDAGQRIYPGGFSLGALGIDVRGRSTVLRVNYRTTEQIRRSADRMLGEVADDLDGGQQARGGTRSLLRGPEPTLAGFDSPALEDDAAVEAVRQWLAAGLAPDEVAAFAATNRRAEAFGSALGAAGVPWGKLSDGGGAAGRVQVGTMHRAKGLEFKAVLVLDCGDAVLPSVRARQIDDPQDREDAFALEQRLLYVAMTRARDELRVSWSGAPSRLIVPLLAKRSEAA